MINLVTFRQLKSCTDVRRIEWGHTGSRLEKEVVNLIQKHCSY